MGTLADRTRCSGVHARHPPIQMAARRTAVTVRAGGNPEPIVQAPFVGIKDDLANRGPLYIDDFKQGISPKSLVSHRARFF